MMKKLLGAAATAAVVLAIAPASAARMEGCSGTNIGKVETTVEGWADGPAKWAAFKEITDAQTAMLDGKMGACSRHLSNAVHAGMTK
jgi:hypothetical protein